MTPPQAKYTNDMQSKDCAFNEYHAFVQHTAQQGRHDLRSMRMSGFVWNTDAKSFLHKPNELEVYTKDGDWAEWAERKHGRIDICGDITIAANVERAEYPPIRIKSKSDSLVRSVGSGVPEYQPRAKTIPWAKKVLASIPPAATRRPRHHEFRKPRAPHSRKWDDGVMELLGRTCDQPNA